MTRKYLTAKTLSDEIQARIRRLLGTEQLRISPVDLTRELQRHFPGTGRPHFKAAVQAMVAAGELIYSHHFNASQLEMNFSGVVEVSERLVLNSNPDQIDPMPGRVCLTVQSGSAFGRGDHPTTLLVLKALDRIAAEVTQAKSGKAAAMLDIGTGTGILAIAAVKLGLAGAVGLDIDAAACHEAVENVRRNRLGESILIAVGDLEALKPARFDVIAANLRPPTLARLMPAMAARTTENGYWILSGFRPEETAVLQQEVPRDFRLIQSEVNRNWAAFAVQRTPS
jgi:ribosomal protein L11 methyltransferase